ncbi:MAG TPA: GWxTD domain-containing protein, partial [Terriglobales bacterium]|nr:GWxTD domain-containing protein [Terriglobales bacterium]
MTLFAGVLALALSAVAQSQPPSPDSSAKPAGKDAPAAGQQASPAGDQADPLKRPLNEKQRKMNQKALYKELSDTDKKWLDEDVVWIITDEEKEAFLKLSNEEEREQFIEQFWLRRDPTPDTEENEYKEEHYRRIAYANEHFASGIPGWRTDRGRMYIMYGPPDEIDAHPSGGFYQRPEEEGGGSTSTYPFEDWRYRYLEGVGQEVEIEFVDVCGCNDYHMTIDRSEKDALLHTPNGGLTTYEEMGLSSKADRMTNGMEQLGKGPFNQNQSQNEFDRIERFAKLQAPPQIKFKDLESVVSHKIRYNLMPFDVQADFVKVTSDTVLVPITIQIKNKDVTFVTKDGVATGVVNIFGRVTSLTGRVAQTFEDTVKVDVPAELLEKTQERFSIYWKALPLRPNRYKLDLVLKDVNGDRMGTWEHALTVPEFSDDKLSASSMILAGQMERVPAKNVGAGTCVIGDTKVCPRVVPSTPPGQNVTFRRDEHMNFWLQIYNLAMDQQTKKPSASVEYEIVNLGNSKQVVHATETTEQMGNIGNQLTLEKSLSLNSLEPGVYQITVRVDDKVAKQSVAPT